MAPSSSLCSTHIIITIVMIIIIIMLNCSIANSQLLATNKNIKFYGDAYLITNSTTNSTSIVLTTQESSSLGGAFYLYPLRFLDSKNKSSASFLTSFSFTINSTSSPVSDPGEGLTFLITSYLGSFNQESGYLGLPELSFTSEDSFVAVEFDTKFDPFVGDINGNHVGLDVDSYASMVSNDGYASGVDFSSGSRVTAWIEYRNSARTFKVWVSYTSGRPKEPVLSAQIDLSRTMKEFMHVGFVASNGMGSAFHIVDEWRFKTFEIDVVPDDKVVPVSAGVEDGDCLVCSPVEAVKDKKHSGLLDRKGGNKVLVIIAAVFGGVLACFIVVVHGVLVWKYIEGILKSTASQVRRIGLNGPEKLSLSELKTATSGFSKNMIIGQGASATVYKGILGDGQVVAVKRFNQISRVDVLKPFNTEFATLARRLSHKNLVELLGWCCEGSELLLVFEFLPNGSLDQILSKGYGAVCLLTWEQRMNIVLGVASCLTYLHEECDRLIIHRDVKTCNVMLDADFTAKLGDFGLAEVYDRACKTRSPTIPAGTMGYLAPEYVYSGVPTEKSDVYSFGVVVLEVVSGRRPVEDDGEQLVDWVWGLWEKGKLIEAVDGRLMGKYSRKDMERMLKVGLCCVHPDRKKRPTVKEAAMMLRDEVQLPALPEKKPSLKLRAALPEPSRRTLYTRGDDMLESPWLTPRSHF